MLDRPILPHKADLALRAANKHHIRSFADLGGCWAVNGGYTFDLLRRAQIEKAYLVDRYITDLTAERSAAFPNLELRGEILFNQPDVIRSFPEVDALIMYDILLHQVNLDWNDFLVEWSKKARVLIIYNQMWTKADHTIRFIDEGKDFYKQWVYYTSSDAIDRWFASHDTLDPETGRPVRDQFYYWQWGITRNDMISCVESQGMRLDYFEDYGPIDPKFPWIPTNGFIFVR